MRIVQLNLAADFALADPDRLLDRYHTLTGWSRAMAGAGADVTVVQRFGWAGTLRRDGVPYMFVNDDGADFPGPWTISEPVLDTLTALSPDVVHVNGLMFPAMTQAIRDVLGRRSAIVLQDHSGAMPARAARALASRRWARAFRAADACSFTARELASRWHRAGLPRELPVLEIPEASTTFTPLPRDDARTRIGMSGAVTLLWVGRLDGNKDPMTVLSALELVLPSMPSMEMWWVVPAESAVDGLVRRLTASEALDSRAHLVHGVRHPDMPLYYSAADVLVSGSRHEGSGYAVIEALACGVTPCLTSIPAFQALTGSCGVFFAPGDVAGCVTALREAVGLVSASQRHAVREHFRTCISWDAVGQRTYAAYKAVAGARRPPS